MNKIIKFKLICISCGKTADKLEDGHCSECIDYFKRQWYVTNGELANKPDSADTKSGVADR